MSKKQVELTFLRSFVSQLEESVKKIEDKSSLYEQTPFHALSKSAQLEFFNNVKDMHSNLWALKTEIELLDSLAAKMLKIGPLVQPKIEMPKTMEELQKYLSQSTPPSDDDTNYN